MKTQRNPIEIPDIETEDQSGIIINRGMKAALIAFMMLLSFPPMMANVVSPADSVLTEFIEAKSTAAFEFELDNMMAYPITFINELGEEETGFIQDVIEKAEDTHYHLVVVILREDLRRIIIYERRCFVRTKCIVNWHNVPCRMKLEIK